MTCGVNKWIPNYMGEYYLNLFKLPKFVSTYVLKYSTRYNFIF